MSPGSPDTPQRARVVTLNFWCLEPPLDVRLALAERQLRALAPDVVAMQEVRPMDEGGRRGRTTAAWLAEALGFEHVYEPAVHRHDGDEGLAILSRHPIVEHRVTRLPDARPDEARILLSAAIHFSGSGSGLGSGPGPAALVWLHCTHLHYRPEDGVARERQVVAVDQAIRELGMGADEAPVHILCGDFNAPPDSDEMRFLRGLTTLAGRRTVYQDAFARVHPRADGFTWCAEIGAARARRTNDADRRLDYVFVSPRRKDGRGTVHDARVVMDERQDHGDISTAASDHYGVLADIQIAGADPAR
jgi:endonuclease/exonuclease/phosphatase family metal-dependent hydrolase